MGNNILKPVADALLNKIDKPQPQPRPPVETLYRKAFGSVPYETIIKIAASVEGTDKTGRGLLLNLLAEPADKACWAALTDFAQEYISRPNEVEFNGRKISTSQNFDYAWWSGAIDAGIAHDLLARLGVTGPRGEAWTYARHRILSLDKLCSQTPEEVLKIPGIKGKRLRKIQLFLGRLGLHLSGDKIHAEETDDDGNGFVSISPP